MMNPNRKDYVIIALLLCLVCVGAAWACSATDHPTLCGLFVFGAACCGFVAAVESVD
jgi:hypothetical protein